MLPGIKPELLSDSASAPYLCGLELDSCHQQQMAEACPGNAHTQMVMIKPARKQQTGCLGQPVCVSVAAEMLWTPGEPMGALLLPGCSVCVPQLVL